MPNNKQIIARFLDEVINQDNIEATGTFFHDDVIEAVPFPGQGPGVDGIKDVLRGMRAGFPDIRWAVDEQIAEGEKLMTRFEWTGTHQGAFLGIAATGRAVKVWGVVIDRFVEGKVKETRIIMDPLGLMMQLGVMPPPQP